jgi:murein DD-endopeptidase MepM/ murein hydrolase activator NlpD
LKKFSVIGAAVIAVAVVVMMFWEGQPVSQQLKEGLYDIKKSIFWEKAPPVEKYGIDLGDLYVCTDVIKPNQNLGAILGENGIPNEVVQELFEKSNGVFDVHKIKSGKSYCLMRSSDSTDQVKYFVYEQDPVNYVVYEIGDSVTVRTGSKKVETIERQASGLISSSLWNTLEENDLDPQLAISMSEIYAWSIDFFRLQKGDFFKVLVEERLVEGRRIGIGEIKAAYFNHGSKDFYAIKYDQDSVPDYFDENALSLKKAFLKAPLQFRRISSNFSHARFHPILKRSRPHLGTDYAAETGTPIWAIGNGVVVQAAFNRGQGNFVEIKHNGTYTTKYLHMSKFGEGIKAGVHVTQGQTIGYVGSTGLATGPHLHFEMIKNGEHTDATKIDMPQGDPIREDCKDAYGSYRDQMLAKLKAIPTPKEVKEKKQAAAEPQKDDNDPHTAI